MDGGLCGRPRCAWARGKDETYTRYHDLEWGTPSHDDRHLFEMLVLEGFQAGLSWQTILNKREAFREAFLQFDPARVARMGEGDVARLMENPGIVRNRLKIESAIRNARVFLDIQAASGRFSDYLWGWTGGRPVPLRGFPVPCESPLSSALSRDLKRRGMAFVGSVIVYSFLQAVGVVNDHEPGCFRHDGQASVP